MSTVASPSLKYLLWTLKINKSLREVSLGKKKEKAVRFFWKKIHKKYFDNDHALKVNIIGAPHSRLAEVVDDVSVVSYVESQT